MRDYVSIPYCYANEFNSFFLQTYMNNLPTNFSDDIYNNPQSGESFFIYPTKPGCNFERNW